MQTEKSQSEGKRIMPECSVNLVSGIIRWPEGWDFSVGNRSLINFLTYDIKNYSISFVISFIYDILRQMTTCSVFRDGS